MKINLCNNCGLAFLRHLPMLLLLPLFLLATGCSKEEKKAEPVKPDLDAQWKAKMKAYPVPVPFPTEKARAPFDFSRSRVVAMMVEKLDGASSKESFDHIRNAFKLIPPDECVPALKEAINQLITASAHTRGILQNACEAAGCVGDPRLVEVLKKATMVREDHKSRLYHRGVQRAATESIGLCATAQQSADLWQWFMGKGGQKSPGPYAQWYLVGSLATIDPPAIAERLGEILADNHLRQPLESIVLETMQKLPAADLAPVMLRFFGEFHGQDKLILARVLHQGGIQQGTDYLLKLLKEAKTAKSRALIIQALGKANNPTWTEEVLVYATDPSVDVRIALITILEDKEGQEINDTLELLANSEHYMVRQQALKVLRKRNYTAPLDQLLEELKKSSGTRHRALLNDLLFAQEKRMIPIVIEMMAEARGAALFQLMRVLGTLGGQASVAPLLTIFKQTRREIRPQVDNIIYSSQMLSNIPEAAPQLMELIQGEIKSDTERRYHLLATLTRIAALDEITPAMKKEIIKFILAYIANEENDTRDRLVLCPMVLRFLSLDDVMFLKRLVMRTRDAYFRKGLNNFLWEFFGRA